MALTVLIADDEPIARQILRDELADLEGIEIAGEASNGREALRIILDLDPDLVFLDLQMPVMGGLEVVRYLRDPAPVVIIVTAFDQHAIQGDLPRCRQ